MNGTRQTNLNVPIERNLHRIMSTTTIAVAILFAFLGMEQRCSAQFQIPQVVQLPTIQTFNIGSTVSVPDRGGALLGGISRGATGRVERGVPILGNIPFAGRLFNNNATGSTYAPSTVSVHAYIIDFEEMERELMAEAQQQRERRQNDPRFDRVQEPDADVKARAAFLSRNIGRRD